MPTALSLQRISNLLLAGLALNAILRARAGSFGNASSIVLLVSSMAMGLIIRQLFTGTNPKLITSPEKVGKKAGQKVTGDDDYDFIIVGGGTAGCVLAARLSEDPAIKVLLLESGVSGKSLILSRIPVGFSLLFKGKHVYNLYTEPQESAKGQRKYWPRGKMLGGCSSINAQMAQYGSPGDFDQWGKIIGDDSWAWSNFKNYFTKFETYIDDPEYPHVDSNIKGNKGPVRVGYHSAICEGSKDFIQSCIKLGIPFRPDFNTAAGTRGVNRVMTYIDETRTRVSSESAYLTEDVLARPNLKVVLHMRVTKVITDASSGDVKVTGVEFCKTKNGPRYSAFSKREVIICAGAVHSPQILMLSGIGPAEELKKHNIPIVKDLPGVGSHLIDHPVVDVYFKNSHNDSPKFVLPNGPIEAVKLIGSAIQYLIKQRGALATNFGEAAAFIRTDDPALFPKSEFAEKLQDSTSSADGPDLELFTTPFAYKEHGAYMFPMHTFAIHVCLLRPISEGSLLLKSSNVWDDPVLDPKYLTSKDDVAKIMRGIKMILKISKVEPLASRLDHTSTSPLLDHQMHDKTDAELEEIIRERVETLYHPTSTCRMAPLADQGVVDAKLRVYGVRGLRVCDASIFPKIVSGHTAGAVLASAEHLADIIKEDLKV